MNIHKLTRMLVLILSASASGETVCAADGLSEAQGEAVIEAAATYFAASPEQRNPKQADPDLDNLVRTHGENVRQLVWQAYREAPIHHKEREDHQNNRVTSNEHVSPYVVRRVGKRPEGGWPLFIAMHGGGGVPKQVNDRQWLIMQRYYRDQRSVTGYKYLALRAPNDTWNGFYDHYVPPLIERLIRQFHLFEDVNPDRVFLMGYSHGGYGAFYIGPKIADRFAAIHASAAAPTPRTISPRTLLNTRFTYMIGERDTMYERRARCEAFAREIETLQKNGDNFPVEMEFQKGAGHSNLSDRDKIQPMYEHVRDPVPKRLLWDMTDTVVNSFFWLSVPEPASGQTIEAELSGQNLVIDTRNVTRFDVRLDHRLIDVSKPMMVTVNGTVQQLEARPRFAELCRTLIERGDPRLAFSVCLSMTGDQE